MTFLKLSKKAEEPAPPTQPVESGEEAIHRTRIRHVQIRTQQRQGVLTATKISPLALRREWTRSYAAAFADQPLLAVNSLDGTMLFQEWRRHAKRGNNPPFLLLMEWSIQNWTLLLDTEFASLANKPAHPVVRFWLACINRFIQAYADRTRVEKRREMTTREQMVERLMDRGRSQEAAEREVDERLGLTALREEIKRERQKLQQLQARTQKDEEHQERLKMMERTLERKQARAVQGVGGTFEQWT